MSKSPKLTYALLKTRLIGHLETIFDVVWSPDGSRIASASGDKTIRIWDPITGRLRKKLKDHTDVVYGVSWSPEGRLLASASADKLVYLWDTVSGRRIRTLEGHTDTVYRVAWSPSGEIIASTSLDKTLRLWHRSGGNEFKILTGHSDSVYGLSWSPNGKRLATGSFDSDGSICIWTLEKEEPEVRLAGHKGGLFMVAWSPNGRRIASASIDKTLAIWDPESGQRLMTLEGHTDAVFGVAWSPDGRCVASASDDQTIRIWDAESGQTIASLKAHTDGVITVAWSPDGRQLASGGHDAVVAVWDVGAVSSRSHVKSSLSRKRPLPSSQRGNETLQYITAKIVLVGDSGVGKTGLGWRLSHGEFKEHSSTHGGQFWVVKDLGATLSDDTECEAVLWDLAGQPDYRLIHTLFLDNVDLALVLFDPSNRQEPLRGVEYWLRALPRRNGVACPVILVGARADRGTTTLTQREIEDFCFNHGISGGYVETSARTGWGLSKLQKRITHEIMWETISATSTTLTFKRLKEYILNLKESHSGKEFIINPKELRRRLRKAYPAWKFSDQEMMTAVSLLENHGYIRLLRRFSGEIGILLAPDLLNDLASSFVLEARRNPKGLGSLHESRVLQGDYHFPEIADLNNSERETLLDATTTLFIQHNICFRSNLGGETFLTFPALINQKKPLLDNIETVEDVSYVVAGAVENVYASLVVLLGYTNIFRRTNHWQNQAQYEVHTGEVCGFRQITEREGEAELILYYGKDVSAHTKALFQGLFENFLRASKLSVSVYRPVKCPKCGYTQERSSVIKRIRAGKEFIFCDECGTKIALPLSDQLQSFKSVESKELETEALMARRRTVFEAALTRVKGIINDRVSRGWAARCLISCAQDDQRLEDWVENRLAKDLTNVCVEVLLDKVDSPRTFTEWRDLKKPVVKVDFTLVVCTPYYKSEIERRVKGLNQGTLAGILSPGLNDSTMEPLGRIIPLLLVGNHETAIPTMLQGLVTADFRDEALYFKNVFDLILQLYGIPFDDPGITDARESLGQYYGNLESLMRDKRQ